MQVAGAFRVGSDKPFRQAAARLASLPSVNRAPACSPPPPPLFPTRVPAERDSTQLTGLTLCKILGERWRTMNNVIWVLGGDTSDPPVAKYRQLLSGLRAGGAQQLVTALQRAPGSSSEFMPAELDFFSIQKSSCWPPWWWRQEYHHRVAHPEGYPGNIPRCTWSRQRSHTQASLDGGDMVRGLD